VVPVYLSELNSSYARVFMYVYVCDSIVPSLCLTASYRLFASSLLPKRLSRLCCKCFSSPLQCFLFCRCLSSLTSWIEWPLRRSHQNIVDFAIFVIVFLWSIGNKEADAIFR
jgi:hypothetical protein